MSNKTTECRFCRDSMDFIACHDNPSKGIAYNLYQCSCGSVCREDVWNSKGKTWLAEDNEITREVDKNDN